MGRVDNGQGKHGKVAGPLLDSLGRTWAACAGEAGQAGLVHIEVKLGWIG
jgi:hypothetical protein